MTEQRLEKEAVLRIGEVVALTGRKIFVAVDQDKNLAELFFDGDLLRNVAVGSYLDIKKGFISLIAKVEGENAQAIDERGATRTFQKEGTRILVLTLVGFVDRKGSFTGGTKELPLVGDEAFLLTRERIHQIHNLIGSQADLSIKFSQSDYEGYEISFPIDGLLNSHIAIFGNTGSGKSNTLAIIFQKFIEALRSRNTAAFISNCKILLFDFNGEYTAPSCLTEHKVVYRLSTRVDGASKIPLSPDELLDLEILSVLADATEKTQKPFLRRSISLLKKVRNSDDPEGYAQNILRQQITLILQMSDKIRASLLLDYLRQLLPLTVDGNGVSLELDHDLDWHNQSQEFTWNGSFLRSNPGSIPNTSVYQQASQYARSDNLIKEIIDFTYIQLIYDVLSNRALNEHVAPAINKLKSKQDDIQKIFDTESGTDLFSENVAVVALNDVNLDMRKTVPLLLARLAYRTHKESFSGKSLNIIIDEAHNILSKESFREAESWKDYRLETFEEIIKEGRKFGVFVTIASQRPSDISHTITSQAHNYFIHRLINQRDLQSIASAVSYIDRITEESIPTLPTGTCIFSGVAGQMPLKITVHPLDKELQPCSATLKYADCVPDPLGDLLG
ncbi:ATPase [Maricaulis sp. W15]|uniref:ATP-binding protein n=1 Tax=Maricaulis sp. W15 TaxID=1772333 RepID=UPI000948DC57|nr:ATP-binding protein [Maricaulis sp. W15]OLF77689.1 ATPase [Maricaulis sp. W15]